MAKNDDEITILDILRKTPGAKVSDMARKIRKSPEAVVSILNDPDFRAYLTQTQSEHLSQLKQLHQIAMERICECLSAHKQIKDAEALSKWLLKYCTDSIVKIGEVNAGTAEQDGGNITINQMLGRDPFKGG